MEYEVQGDESVGAIALRHGLSEEELSAAIGSRSVSTTVKNGDVIDVPVVFRARDGDTLASIASRFGLDPTDLDGPNRDLADTGHHQRLDAYERVLIPLRDELDLLVESVAHTEFLASHADLDGIDADELARSCLAHEPQHIAYARRRLEDVLRQRYAPRNRWDKLYDVVIVLISLAAVGALVLGLVDATQWVLRQILDDYVGWAWADWWGWCVAVGIVLGVVSVPVSAASRRVDSSYLRNSKWAARRRDFETAVRNFAVQPTIRELTKVHFRAPADDEVRIDSSALTTTARADQVIRTDTYREISRHLARADGATLGLRGSRRSGKTDIVRAFCGISRRPADIDEASSGQSDEGPASPIRFRVANASSACSSRPRPPSTSSRSFVGSRCCSATARCTNSASERPASSNGRVAGSCHCSGGWCSSSVAPCGSAPTPTSTPDSPDKCCPRQRSSCGRRRVALA